MYNKSNQGLFATLENGTGYTNTHDNHVINPFVNFHNHANTQALARSLVSESVQMKGVEMYYIRREFVNFDKIFGEDLQAKFKKAYRVAMYIESFDGYSGQQDFFSKFGMQVNDEITCVISPELFNKQADGNIAKEGDLIYFPSNQSLFELIWVEPNAPFLQVGQVSQYKITAQKFVYSGEEIQPEFNAADLLYDANLAPIRALDKRADTNIIEFEEDDIFNEETSSFVAEFNDIIGTGGNKVKHKTKPVSSGIDESVVDGFEEFEEF